MGLGPPPGWCRDRDAPPDGLGERDMELEGVRKSVCRFSCMGLAAVNPVALTVLVGTSSGAVRLGSRLEGVSMEEAFSATVSLPLG